MPSHHFLRRLLHALALPAAGLGLAAAAATPAHAATIVDNEVCQYNYDSYWRAMPITITGRVTDAAGVTIPDGTNVAPGTKVQLRDATLKADQLRNGTFADGLPDWIETFGYDSGFLQDGTVVPLSGYAAFEATNTVEGVQDPVAFDTDLVTDLTVVNGQVDEAASSLTVLPAQLPVVEWTAAGGPISVRQAPGTKMAPIPVGRTGADVRVNGSVFVEADLGAAADGLKLTFDCTVGDQATTGAGGQGADHTDRLAKNLAGTAGAGPDPAQATVRSRGWAGTVAGGGTPGPLAGAVDLAATSATVGRAPAGAPATVSDAKLGLRLTEDQVTAWLGNTGQAVVGGTVTLHGDGSAQGSQAAAVLPGAAVDLPAAGEPLTLALPLAVTTWSPTGDLGVDVRTADSIVLAATVGGQQRTLTLTRGAVQRATAYPFAYVLGPDPRTPPAPSSGGGTGTTNPPPLDTVGPGVIAPPPVLNPAPVVVPPKADPKPVRKIAPVKLGGSTLKRSRGRLKVTLQNLVAGVTKGRLSLVTKSKYKVGKAKKAKRITLLKATSFSLPKGKKKTFSLKLSKDATALLKRRRSVKATLTATPSAASTQKVVSRTVTVRR